MIYTRAETMTGVVPPSFGFTAAQRSAAEAEASRRRHATRSMLSRGGAISPALSPSLSQGTPQSATTGIQAPLA
jgi:hypothetical protein